MSSAESFNVALHQKCFAERASLYQNLQPDPTTAQLIAAAERAATQAADGNTYDRSSIEAWLKTGKKTSPKTNAPLPSTALYPNHAVKSMVQDYLETCKKHHC